MYNLLCSYSQIRGHKLMGVEEIVIAAALLNVIVRYDCYNSSHKLLRLSLLDMINCLDFDELDIINDVLYGKTHESVAVRSF